MSTKSKKLSSGRLKGDQSEEAYIAALGLVVVSNG